MSTFFSVVLSVFLTLYVQTSISATGSCYYFSEDGSSSFTVQRGWMNLTDTKQNTWFINPCIADGSESSPCPYNSGVCVQYFGSDNTVSTGELNDYLFSAIENGIEYDFGSETSCLVTPQCMGCEPLKMKTSLLLNCDPQAYMAPVSSIDSDGCYTMIMLNSSSFCAPVYLDGDMPSNIANEHRVVYINLPFLLLITCGSLISICVCCCCAIRRRRCRRQRQQAMQNISNQAFRAIPNQQTFLKQAQQPVAQSNNVIPAFNPFMMPQQQFVYYYPSQQQVANQQASIVQPTPQVQLDDEDEKMAIELQAQFDNESRV